MQLKPVTGIVILLLLVALISAAGCTSNSSTPTVKATVAATETPKATATPTPTAVPTATAAPTATPKPTEVPTLSSYHGLLLEHPASVNSDDLSGKINENTEDWYKLITPFHRATIDGRDVYIGTFESDQGLKAKTYIFPLGSYGEARAAQSVYVKQFQSKGFIVSRESTTNSKEESMIWTDNGAEEVDIQALGYDIVLRDTALNIYIPEQKGYSIS